MKSTYEKDFTKPKSMLMLCRRTLHPIVFVLIRSARVMENAKNASNITKRKAKCHTAQDNRFFISQHSKNCLSEILISLKNLKKYAYCRFALVALTCWVIFWGLFLEIRFNFRCFFNFSCSFRSLSFSSSQYKGVNIKTRNNRLVF